MKIRPGFNGKRLLILDKPIPDWVGGALGILCPRIFYSRIGYNFYHCYALPGGIEVFSPLRRGGT